MIKQGSAITDPMAITEKKGGVGVKPVRYYERENSIVAHVINNLTCSMRFEGDLNVDLNEITMNLVPYPRMHFLLSSLSPLYSILQPGQTHLAPRGIDDTFREAMERSN
jgi:tubulin epsilon